MAKTRKDSRGYALHTGETQRKDAFRIFADKEEVDYSDKEKKFSKTEVAKKPWKW